MSDHQFGIEYGPFLKHEVDRSTEFVGQDRITFKFSMFGYEQFSIRCQQRMIPLTDNRTLPESPAQIGVNRASPYFLRKLSVASLGAHLASAESFDFSGGRYGSFDEPAVADEVLDRRKPVNGINFKHMDFTVTYLSGGERRIKEAKAMLQ